MHGTEAAVAVPQCSIRVDRLSFASHRLVSRVAVEEVYPAASFADNQDGQVHVFVLRELRCASSQFAPAADLPVAWELP